MSSHPVRWVATAFAIRLAIPRHCRTTVDQSCHSGTSPPVFVELHRVKVVGPRQRKLAHDLPAHGSPVACLRTEAIHRRERREDFVVRQPTGDRRHIEEIACGVSLNDQPRLYAQDLRLRGNPDLVAGDCDLGGLERGVANLVPYPREPATTWSASIDRRRPAARAAAVPPTSVTSGRIPWRRAAAARSCSQSGS